MIRTWRALGSFVASLLRLLSSRAFAHGARCPRHACRPASLAGVPCPRRSALASWQKKRTCALLHSGRVFAFVLAPPLPRAIRFADIRPDHDGVALYWRHIACKVQRWTAVIPCSVHSRPFAHSPPSTVVSRRLLASVAVSPLLTTRASLLSPSAEHAVALCKAYEGNTGAIRDVLSSQTLSRESKGSGRCTALACHTRAQRRPG